MVKNQEFMVFNGLLYVIRLNLNDDHFATGTPAWIISSSFTGSTCDSMPCWASRLPPILALNPPLQWTKIGLSLGILFI
jgi:hypothetical protein